MFLKRCVKNGFVVEGHTHALYILFYLHKIKKNDLSFAENAEMCLFLLECSRDYWTELEWFYIFINLLCVHFLFIFSFTQKYPPVKFLSEKDRKRILVRIQFLFSLLCPDINSNILYKSIKVKSIRDCATKLQLVFPMTVFFLLSKRKLTRLQ